MKILYKFTIVKYIRKGLQTFVLQNQKLTFFDFIQLQTHVNLPSSSLNLVQTNKEENFDTRVTLCFNFFVVTS